MVLDLDILLRYYCCFIIPNTILYFLATTTTTYNLHIIHTAPSALTTVSKIALKGVWFDRGY